MKKMTSLVAATLLVLGGAAAAEPSSTAWISVPFADGVPNSLIPFPRTSVEIEKVLDHTDTTGFQALSDGNNATTVLLEGCATGLVNELIFDLNEPIGLGAVRFLTCKEDEPTGLMGFGEVAVYISENIGTWGPPVRRVNISGSSPIIPFPETRGRYVRLLFQPVVWDKTLTHTKVKAAECTFYRAGLQCRLDGADGRKLVDGLADSKLDVHLPGKLSLQSISPRSISGISLLLDSSTPIDPAMTARITAAQKVLFDGKLFGELPTIGSVDGRLSKSLFFSTTSTDRIELQISSPNADSLSICEINWLQKQQLATNTPLARITIDPAKVIRPVNPRIFGANIEYWLDDDSVLSDKQFEKRINETGITVLRYPGGTESDRYLWKEHKLYNKAYWPFIDGPQTTDTDEMMAFAEKVGAEVILCVNTEVSFFEKDWKKGAEYAAEWVAYCKEKGYKVKYWTIGNEMYWKYQFTAKDYGKLARLYADKMKAADPSIQIAVAGEAGRWFVGKKDKVVGEGCQLLDELQDKRERLEVNHIDYQRQANELFETYANPKPDLWWPTVFETAGDLIDGVEVHLYPSDPKNTFMKAAYAEELRLLKQYAEEQTGHPVSMAVTEWNLSNSFDAGKDAEGMEQGLYVGEFLGSLIRGGTDIATFWPITMQGTWIPKSLVVEKHHDVLPSFYGFALAANNLSGELIASRCSLDGFYTLASHDAQKHQTTLLIYGRPQVDAAAMTQLQIDLTADAFNHAACTHIELLHAPAMRSFAIQRLEPAFQQTGGTVQFIMPRYAMAVVTIQH